MDRAALADFLRRHREASQPADVGIPATARRRTPGLRREKVLVHPELGPIELDCQVLFTEDQSISLLVLTAPPHTEGHEKLQLLSVLGQERFAEAERG